MNAATFCQLCKDINQKIPGLLPEYENKWDMYIEFLRDGEYPQFTLEDAADHALGRYYVWKANINGTIGGDDIWDVVREIIEPIEDFAEDNLRERLKRAKEKA